MAIDKDYLAQIDQYEQLYFSLDEPVPFKNNLVVYPIKVKDYYKFYGCLGCLTFDKTVKYIPDGELGKLKKVSNPEGIVQTNLQYLVSQTKDERIGAQVTSQILQMFELIFHVNKGIYCPNCHKEISYSEALSGIDEYVANKVNEVQKEIDEVVKKNEIEIDDEKMAVINTLLKTTESGAKQEYFDKMLTCPDCNGKMRDIFSIKEDNGSVSLMVKDVELTNKDFDKLRMLVPRQNIIDYHDDEYMDPELREELEIKSKLQNSDYTSPTLEKQLVCIAADTGLTFEYLKTITMRKLSILLKTIDRKHTYYAQLQGEMSGMVKFKEDPKHWIFSDDKYNIAKELTGFDEFAKKFDQVT